MAATVRGLSALKVPGEGNLYTVEALLEHDSGLTEVRVCDPFAAESFAAAIAAKAGEDATQWNHVATVKNA